MSEFNYACDNLAQADNDISFDKIFEIPFCLADNNIPQTAGELNSNRVRVEGRRSNGGWWRV